MYYLLLGLFGAGIFGYFYLTSERIFKILKFYNHTKNYYFPIQKKDEKKRFQIMGADEVNGVRYIQYKFDDEEFFYMNKDLNNNYFLTEFIQKMREHQEMTQPLKYIIVEVMEGEKGTDITTYYEKMSGKLEDFHMEHYTFQDLYNYYCYSNKINPAENVVFKCLTLDGDFVDKKLEDDLN